MNSFNAFENKELTDLSIDELAYIHLSASTTRGYKIKEGTIGSKLSFLVDEINHTKSRLNSKNLVPVISSFAILDQIGFTYKRNDIVEYTGQNVSGVKKALYYFCNFQQNSEETKALYALRNSLLHNGSLVSISKYAGGKSYSFIYDRDQHEIIKPALIPWNGVFKDFKSSDMTTIVNPEKIIEIATSSVQKALDHLERGELEVILPDKEIELYYRFLKLIK